MRSEQKNSVSEVGAAVHSRRAAPNDVAPNEIRARSFRIRNSWTDEERMRRAQTAKVVQWMLLGSPVGFRLESK